MNFPKKRVLVFILPFFYDGGVERLTANIVNYLSQSNETKVYIYLIRRKIYRGDKFFNSPELFNDVLVSFPQLIRILYNNHNVYVFSLLTPANLFATFLKLFFSFKLMVSFQCSLIQGVPKFKLRLLPLVYGFMAKFADGLHVITKGVRDDLTKLVGPSKKILELNNPTIFAKDVVPSITRKIYPQKNAVRFVSLGRLESQKGFDLTIKAFAEIKARYSNFSYHIAGEGSQRALLENLIDTHQLQKHIIVEGFKNDYKSFYMDKDVYLFPSRFEGMGLALVEALSTGIPVIASDCDYGPSEILMSNKLGILVEDFLNPHNWQKAIEEILSKEEYQWQIPLENHLNRFSVEHFVDTFFKFFDK